MKLGDILSGDRIRLGVSAAALEDALVLLLRALGEASGLDESAWADAAASMVSGESGFLARANEDALLAVLESPDAPEAAAALGVFRHGFESATEEGEEGERARVLLLLATPRRQQLVRAEAVPRLARSLRVGSTSSVLLSAGSVEQVEGLDVLMGTQLRGALLVSDAMSHVTLRVYPDTPLAEVVDLMVRRKVASVPVVGPSYEVLGVLHRADALGRLVEASGADGTGASAAMDMLEDVPAREVMSRSVFCVEEDQALSEAARVMVGKGFDHLPVVRQGELVGVIHQGSVLRMLSGR